MGIIDIASEKYISFTTYRADGTPKPTATWIADLGDGTVGFTTASSSWKVKRMAKNQRVQLQPSDNKGKVKDGTDPVEATATVSKADFDRVAKAVGDKYGVQYKFISLFGKLMKMLGRGSGTDTAVIISPR